MKAVFEAFHILSTSCRGFTLRLPNSVIDPEFSRQFQRATIAFDTFARQIAVVYGSVDPSDEIRLSFKMSPLYLTGAAFIHEWIDFIDIFSTVADPGIAPRLSMIDDLLSVYSNGLNTCVRTVNSTNAASKCAEQLSELSVNLGAITANCAGNEHVLTAVILKSVSSARRD
jgi:hypothetical protein